MFEIALLYKNEGPAKKASFLDLLKMCNMLHQGLVQGDLIQIPLSIYQLSSCWSKAAQPQNISALRKGTKWDQRDRKILGPTMALCNKDVDHGR